MSKTIKKFSQTGEEKGKVSLNPAVFAAKVNEDLMHRSVIMRLANGRQNIAHTKTRAEVRGGGRKPWRQKGTGRARAGSIRGPIWRGGGVAFGPRNNRNFKKNMPRRERRAAIFSALTVKANSDQIYALDTFVSEVPKTKMFSEMLSSLPKARKTLFVVPEKSEVFTKSARNIPGTNVILVNYLNVYDLLHNEKVCFVGESLKKVEEVFLKEKK